MVEWQLAASKPELTFHLVARSETKVKSRLSSMASQYPELCVRLLPGFGWVLAELFALFILVL